MRPPDDARWFAEQVQPHEPALRAYLRARFPSLDDLDDIVQVSYTRLLRAWAAGRVRYPKAFLFVTARNAALDLFRQRRTRPVHIAVDGDEATGLCDDQPGLAEQGEQAYRLEILAEAVRDLPNRCREVVMLRYVDGLSYKAIAAHMDISPDTVKVQLANGLRRCSQRFVAAGLIAPPDRIQTEKSP